MNRTLIYSAPLCALLFSASVSYGQMPKTGAASKYFCEPEIARKADSVLKKMTLDEKIGQLVLFAGKGVVTGPGGSKNSEEYIGEGRCGGVFNITTQAEAMRMQRIAVEKSRLGIPLLFGFDVIHGFKTIFPVNIGISCSWDIPSIENYARISAVEASAAGINWTFSPMCDISHDPRWGRVSEGSGEDPYLGSLISAAMVRGYQGNDLSLPTTILSCVKHFAAYGAAQAGRDYHTVDMSERMLRDIYLPPYRAGIDAGAATVMTSFNEYDGVPATANKFLMKDLLRDELGFNGFVVTDYTATNELIPHGVAADAAQAGELALNADVNMDMVGGTYLLHAGKLVEQGKVSEQTIDRLCREILAMKFRLGLFDDPYRYCSEGAEAKTFYKPEHLNAARSLARSSMVLLENNGALPIAKQSKIALIGPFGNAAREMLGSWVICGEASRATTFLNGLRQRYGVENVSFEQGCKPDGQLEGGFSAAVKAAQNSDVVLLTLGQPHAWSGEAASVTDLKLPDVQMQLLQELKKTGKPIVILLVAARPIDLSRERELADAILVTWNPGTMAGQALADVVSGDYNPSARLSMTFPRSVGQVPIHYNMKSTGRPVGFQSMSSQKYTSRYLFTPNTPLYCFGYGLSYTNFEYTDLKIENPKLQSGQTLQVSVKVSNTGKQAGHEVAQLYIRDLIGSVTRPVRELKGFSKIYLKAAESRTVTFSLTPEELSFYRADRKYGQEAGEYNLWIGANSDATLMGTFTVQ